MTAGIGVAQMALFTKRLSTVTVGGLTVILDSQTLRGVSARGYGAAGILLGTLVLGVGTYRFFHTQTVLSTGNFPVANLSIFAATVSMAVVAALLLVISCQI